jgi:hypothetical protein
MRDPLPKSLPGVALTLVVFVALLPVNSAFAMSNASGVVHSAVTIAGTNDPLVGVTIKVVDMKTAETVAEGSTTDEGLADISNIPLGLYQVTVVAPEGYASAAGPLVFFDEDNTAANLSFALEPLPSAPPAGAILGWPIWAILLLLGGAAVVVGGVVYQVTKEETG